MADTIYALASGRGRAGVAVIRLSGPLAHEVVRGLCGDVPAFRRASVRTLRWDGEVIDAALVLTFAEGASFTGEASAELHVHGGLAVIDAVFRAIGGVAGVRLAGPGEFTRRALENGRLELHEVEGLVDLIDAETEAQRKQAQRLLQGDLLLRARDWRERLLAATALVEVTIDFADEDVPTDVWPEVRRLLAGVAEDLKRELAGARMAERVRAGFEVAIFGPPNVGKSSLINALVGREVAITSGVAGTTRDIIEVRLDLGGIPVVLLDTAGLRDTDDAVEMEGVRRARARVAQADLRVVVLDEEHAEWDAGFVPDIVVASKADLGWTRDGAMSVSARMGAGLEALRDEMALRLARMAGMAGVVVNERHRASVAAAEAALANAIEAIGRGVDVELVALDLQRARHFLEALTGRIDVEEVLGAIFGRFCIGK